MAETATFIGKGGSNEGQTFTAEVGSQEYQQYIDFGFELQDTGGAAIPVATSQTGQTQVSAAATNIAPEEGADETITGSTAATVATPESVNTDTTIVDEAIKNAEAEEAQAKADKEASEAEKERLEIELEETEGGISEIAEEMFEESEVGEKREELSEIKKMLAALEQKLQLSLAELENQAIPMEFIVGQQALLQRQVLAKAKYLTSKAAIVQEELNFAKEELNFYFDAAVADHQLHVQNLQLLLGYARDDIIRLSNDEKDAADRQIELALERERQIQEDRDKITQLMVDNPDAWVGADISLDMTYEEMTQKMAEWMASQPAAGNFQSKVVNGRLFTFDPATGQFFDSGITVPKQSVSGGTGTKLTSQSITEFRSQLEASKGDDGFVNTDKYKELRAQSSNKSEFDVNFSHMLNPNDPGTARILTKEQQETPEEQFVSEDFIRSKLSNEDLDTIADELGLQKVFASREAERNSAIDEIMEEYNLIKSGNKDLTDAQILRLLNQAFGTNIKQ